MHITKASLDDKKVMRWAAVNSDTDKDLYEERMSLELYADFKAYVEGKKDLPEEFKPLVYSEYWKGGMPYLSISHYPDLNGKAVPGQPKDLFVDGNRLKAKGILFDSPLGHSVYRSLKEDKNNSVEDKIRISIGFLDLAHKHGDNGNLWVRDSAYSLCQECLDGVGDKVYVQGCLIHLALTRVPVNQRTEMVLEEKSMAKKAKKTRKDDAESIVGKAAADEIDAMARVSPQKSDVLIEMSDAEEPSEEVEDTSEEVEEEVSEEAPAEEDVEEVEEEVAEPVVEDAQVEKSEDSTMAGQINQPPPYVENLPYGGATSMKDAENYVAARNEVIFLADMWSVFLNVVWNIFDRPDVVDKRSALNTATDEFKNVLTAKAMLTFSVAGDGTVSKHELQPVLDELLNKVDNSLTLESDSERAEMLNPAMQVVGKAITDWIEQKSVAQEPPAPDKHDKTLLDDIREIIQPLSETLKNVVEDVGVLKAQQQASGVETSPQMPKSRTLSSATMKSVAEVYENPMRPKNPRDVARKSVGL
jgi:hypothetical protein